jgi:hypothetical protein
MGYFAMPLMNMVEGLLWKIDMFVLTEKSKRLLA